MARPTCFLSFLVKPSQEAASRASAAWGSSQMFQQAPRALSRRQRRQQPGLCHPRLFPGSQVTARGAATVEETMKERREGQSPILHEANQQKCCLCPEHQANSLLLKHVTMTRCGQFRGGHWCNPCSEKSQARGVLVQRWCFSFRGLNRKHIF